MIKAGCISLILSVAAIVPAHADLLTSFFERYGTCYARHYDRAHLASHPRQKVTAIYLSHTAQPDPNTKKFVLDFGFVLRDGEHYSANAYCANNACSLEGDGGRFSVSETGDGLKLTVGEFLGLEGRAGWSGDLSKSDDRVFLIFPESPRACSFD